MQTTLNFSTSTNKQPETNNLWDAFENYLDSTYFPGASQVLETKLVAFEYETFKNCYSA